MSSMKSYRGTVSARRDNETAAIIPFGAAHRRAHNGSRITAKEAETRLAISQAIRALLRIRELSLNEFLVADWLLMPTVYGRLPWIASTSLALNGDEWLPSVLIGKTSYFAALRGLEEKGIISRKRLPSGVAIHLHIDQDAALTCFCMWQKQATGRSA
ncbi:hypothetical protein [Paracoccus sp. AS002]|uniref:hypothetical protein n=1 Tax=Paracoccus sp. AS002 TaxID=3019545 RepID=UPI0023E81097|nr:hypothetical protein [Paracoccus sp. AS002]MDF3907261.1 hypothetical protein [Paracoccus sp. AS002]